MTNRNYVNGANFERKVKKELEEQGWTVFRTAGSHGIVDLIGFYTKGCGQLTEICKPLVVQCKISGVISTKDRRTLKEWGESFGVNVYVAYREKEGRRYITRMEQLC